MKDEKIMKMMTRQILMAAAALGTVQAIEPPVNSHPVPPRAPAREVPVERELPAAEAPKARPVPMPEVAEVAPARPFLGVILDPVPEILSQHLKLGEGEGLVIGDLVSGGPADKAGLKADDLLTRVDGEVVGTPEEVRARVEKHAVGDTVQVEVIQQGERREVGVVLGEAPLPGAPGIAMAGGMNLDEMLQQIPEKHAELLREAFERNMRPFDPIQPEADLPGEILKRLKDQVGKQGFDFNFNAESTIRLMDEQGSIEMKSRDGHKEAKAFDTEGKLLWEGPYDTEQDKAAVPDEIRERIDRLNVDLHMEGNGLQLRLGPERFRPLDEIELPDGFRQLLEDEQPPAAPEPAPAPEEGGH